MHTALDRYKNESYTGENRCTPCTVVNVALAALLGVVLGAFAAPVGAVAFVAGLGSIYFRGYLVPGTPELTKRYFPDWLLAKFDKVEEPPVGAGEGAGGGNGTGAGNAAVGDSDAGGTAADDAVGAVAVDDTDDSAVARARDETDAEGIVDPETLLTAVDVVEECDDRDDICLTDAFAEEWTAHADRLRDDHEAQRTAVAELFDLEDVTLERDDDGRFVASVGDDQFNAWVTEGALLADLAAATVIADRTDWDAILPAQRVAILRALRSFLDVCPMCGGEVWLTEDTVDSCCRTWDVLAVRCADCDTHFLEINPERLGGASGGGGSTGDDTGDDDTAAEDGDGEDDAADDATGSGNAESVDPGFTRG